MLDRIDKDIDSKDKTMVTLYLPTIMATKIRQRSAELGKTQSKYISDLVESDISYSICKQPCHIYGSMI